MGGNSFTRGACPAGRTSSGTSTPWRCGNSFTRALAIATLDSARNQADVGHFGANPGEPGSRDPQRPHHRTDRPAHSTSADSPTRNTRDARPAASALCVAITTVTAVSAARCARRSMTSPAVS